jgi:origin recognition complex subunit 5
MLQIARHLLSPSPFTLDRCLAILHAIVPHDVPQTAEIYIQIATLRSLRLLLRTGIGGDPLDVSCKWRVNAGFEYVSAIGRSVGFELSDYLPPSD